MVDIKYCFKIYFLYIALPISVLVALYESATAEGSYLNFVLKHTVRTGNAELFFLERGGQRNNDRGGSYYSRIVMPIYEKDEGRDMKFKDFMVWHVTEYEPALFLELASDWPALTEWDLTTEHGQTTFKTAFGQDHLEILESWSPTYSEYLQESRKQYSTIDDFLEALDTSTDFSAKYTSRNGWQGGQSRFQILE